METIIVGEGALTVHEVARVIEKSAAFAILLTTWRLFAGYIGVNDAEILGLDKRINLSTLELKEIPREILKLWKAAKGTKATLEALCNALDECHLSVIAEALKAKFCPRPVQQEKQIEFALHEKVYTLEQLFENNVPEQISELIESYCKAHSATGPIPIVRREVCSFDLPEHYIPRTFSEQNELDEKIFSAYATKEHIFLVTGATKPELARACGFKPIERSGNQLDKVTVRHILLECDDDFDAICGNTTKPVHMIEFKDNSFFHLKSTKGMNEVQGFVKENGVSFGEEEAVTRITNLESPSSLSIADSPGMGKTFALGKLSADIQINSDKAVTTLFIVLQELVQNLNHSNSVSTYSVIEAISTYASSNNLTKLILQEMLKNSNHQFFLFLDGYDEVMQEKLHFIDSLLHTLNNLPNIKVIVTTRPHLKPRLENKLQKLSYRILPFNEFNQIEFLTKYWSHKHGANNTEMLEAFAEKCLHSLQTNMSDKERNIAGIPLQCYMLAEVYAKQAKRASKLKSLPEDVVKITSFFEMYKSLMHLKFQKVGTSKELRRKYFDAHVHDAIALLFPDWLERFKPLLTPREEVKEAMMYSIGLIEKSPSSNTPRFLHRTFAENLLAQFTLWNLGKDGTSVQFLYTGVLGTIETIQNIDLIPNNLEFFLRPLPLLYKLRHPVIAYFVEMHLRDRLFCDESNFKFQNALDLTNISGENLCTIMNACCCHDLENCFDLTRKILEKLNIKANSELRDKYFMDLPRIVVEWTNNVSLLQKVLNLTKLELYVNLDWHICEGYFSSKYNILQFTPLHLAVYHGKYNMVMYLLEVYGQNVFSVNYLMHSCLIGSAKNRNSVIEDKLLIIESLTRLTRTWLLEYFEGKKPILQIDAHVTLIKYLVQLGVDINTYSKEFGTILHCGGDKSTYAELVDWALKNDSDLINHRDGNGRTPLMSALERFGTLRDDVLQLFYDGGADFDNQDNDGMSVLMYAVKYSGRVNFVTKILDFGAGLNHTDANGRNAAHLAIGCSTVDRIQAFKLLKLLLSRRFNGLHQKDKWDSTPFQEAIKYGIVDDEILRYFVEAGVDEDGNSVLLNSIRYRLLEDFFQTILEFGENVNHRNNFGENAAHLIMKCRGYNNKYYPIRAVQFLQLLDSRGFNGLHQKNTSGYTPVAEAIKNGIKNDEILKYFVDAGADDDGNSVLFYAIKHRWGTDIIKKLLEFGENVNHRNNLGENAAHLIMECDSKGKTYDPIRALQLLKRLDSRGFNRLHQKNTYGNTPVAEAIKKGIIKNGILKYFVAAGPDEDGNSVLFYALQHGRGTDIIKKLLKFGENVNHRNRAGENAAHVVIKYQIRDPQLVLENLEMLESNGFTGFNQMNSRWETPLRLARRLKVENEELLKYLKDRDSFCLIQ